MRSLEIELRRWRAAKAWKLTFRLPVSRRWWPSDRLLLRRLLQNLISNAIKYTPAAGGCWSARRRGQSLQIGVYTTASAFPSSSAARIFKEFHRLEQGARGRNSARSLWAWVLSIVERLERVDQPRPSRWIPMSARLVLSVTVAGFAKAVNTQLPSPARPPLSRAERR